MASSADVENDGEKQKATGDVLHRGLGLLSNFAMGFTEVGVLSSISITYGDSILRGGPISIVWSFVATSIATIIIGYSMAELCAACPRAGSVYAWTAQVVTPAWRPLACYVTGWTNWIGNTAGDASFAIGWTSLLSAAVISSGGQEISQREQVGVSIAILWLWGLVSCLRVDQVGFINLIACFTHISAIVIIVVSILVNSETLNTGDYVFGEYYNDTGFEERSYVGAIGFTSALFIFVGYEASGHCAEETHNGAESAPRGIIMTIVTTCISGIFLLICFLFATVDIAALSEHESGSLVVGLFMTANAKYPELGLTCVWLVVINLWFAGLASVAVSGRIGFALARDDAFPGSYYMKKVTPGLKAPVPAIMFILVFDSLLQLLPLDLSKAEDSEDTGGAAALTAVLGLSTLGFQFSYAMPILMKVCFRPANFPKTKYDLGRLSIPLGIFSSGWLLITNILYFFPTAGPVTQHSMNWLIVVVAILFVIMVLDWWLRARRYFTGPCLDDTVQASDEMNSSKSSECLAAEKVILEDPPVMILDLKASNTSTVVVDKPKLNKCTL